MVFNLMVAQSRLALLVKTPFLSFVKACFLSKIWESKITSEFPQKIVVIEKTDL